MGCVSRGQLLVAVGLGLVSTGCVSTQSLWLPAPAQMAGTDAPSVAYTLRRAAPEGSVRIATLGVRDVDVRDTERSLLVVRMQIENRSPAPWRLDVAEQRLVLAGGISVRPDLVYSSTRGGPPVLDIAARSQVTVDLLYPLPPQDDAPERIAIDWAIDTPGIRVGERATFDGIEVDTNGYVGVAPPAFYTGIQFGYPHYPFYLSPFYSGYPFFYRPFYAPNYWGSYYGPRVGHGGYAVPPGGAGPRVVPAPMGGPGGFGPGMPSMPMPRVVPAPPPARP